MASKRSRIVSLLLVVMMLMGILTVATVSTSAASGDTVYCKNDAGWSEVYCYMWKDGVGDNHSWPGIKMTKGDDGYWSYNITGDWNMIIFNNNQGTQTGDMSYPGNGKCYNNSTNQWGDSPVPPVTNPTTPTDPSVEPTNPTTPPTPAGKNVIYCQNDAGWGSVSVYLWNSDSDKDASWPGTKATLLGDNIWMYEYDKDYANVIFNNGGQGTQTADLQNPGTGYLYNNSTGQWVFYDVNKLHIKEFTTDVAAPQYTGVDILLSMNAGGGEGELSYKFAVNNTVISDFSAKNSVTWTPTAAGTYTLTFTVKDEAGETLTKTMSYEIKDIKSEVTPVIKSVSVTPADTSTNVIQKGVPAKISVDAGGGNVGTKLLFYKVKVTDPAGETANVPYYSLKNQIDFTPTKLGKYSFTVSVQASDNSFKTRTVEYECVSEMPDAPELSASLAVSGKTEVGSTVTAKATVTGGTAPYTYKFTVNGSLQQSYSVESSCAVEIEEAGSYTVEVTVKDATGATVTKSTTFVAEDKTPTVQGLKGDADGDGVVSIKDASQIQKHAAKILTLEGQLFKNADVDGDNTINVKDASTIQKYLAKMDVDW